MNKSNTLQHLGDLFDGLSTYALASCINYVNKEILNGHPYPGKVAYFAYKLYCKAVNLEQYSNAAKLKGSAQRSSQS
jgi:hypothetical protein